MNDSVYQVFLSSTWVDLGTYRSKVQEGIDRLRHLPFDVAWYGMEDFPASSEDDSLTVALSYVSRSDIYVGVLGPRYGTIVPGRDISYVEAEYNHAVELGRPRLLFLMDERCEQWLRMQGGADDHRRAKLDSLRSRFSRDRYLNYFDSPADLALKVVIALLPNLVAKRESTVVGYLSAFLDTWSTPATSIVLIAEASAIRGDGSEKSTVTAYLADASGSRVEGEEILWTASEDSTVNPRSGKTWQGVATTVLTPLAGGPRRIVVNCLAVRSGISSQIAIDIVAPT